LVFVWNKKILTEIKNGKGNFLTRMLPIFPMKFLSAGKPSCVETMMLHRTCVNELTLDPPQRCSEIRPLHWPYISGNIMLIQVTDSLSLASHPTKSCRVPVAGARLRFAEVKQPLQGILQSRSRFERRQ
jgi:hypothetical protein